MIFLQILGSLWLAWVVINLLLMVMVKTDQPSFNGFWITVPERYKDILTRDEYWAIHTHEEGHRYHHHVWKNFARVCLFRRSTERIRVLQELQADDYAAKYANPQAMASALRKLSNTALDNVRARRLEMLSTVEPQ